MLFRRSLFCMPLVFSRLAMGMLAGNLDPLPPNVEQLMKWEFESNTALDILPLDSWDEQMTQAMKEGTKENARILTQKEFEVQYFEIPETQASLYSALEIPPEIENAVIFYRDGRKYFRWLLNPEGRPGNEWLKKALDAQGVPTVKGALGPGFLSASRSCLARDPVSGKVFFYKASASRSVGPWKGKRVDTALTQASVQTGKLTQQVKSRMKLDSLIPLEEPLGISIQTKGIFETDRGVIFRSLGDFPENKHYLLPVFSALHSEEGRRIATLHPSDPDSMAPFRYWKTHLMIPLARAAAELLATHGFAMTSVHGQQFLVDLDPSYIPTGKIAFRDWGDSEIVPQFFQDEASDEIRKTWSEENSGLKKRNEEIFITSSPLKGSVPPDWFEDEHHRQEWVDAYTDQFIERFSQLTQIQISDLQKSIIRRGSWRDVHLGFYFVFNTQDPLWQRWFTASECFRGLEYSSRGLECLDLLDCYAGTRAFSSRGYSCTEVLKFIAEGRNGPRWQGKPEVPPSREIKNEYYDYSSPTVIEDLRRTERKRL